MSISLGNELWASAAWERKQRVFSEQPSTDMPRSKSIISRGAAASTATVFLDSGAEKRSYSISPPAWFGPSPTEILTLLQFPSVSLMASSRGEQGKSCWCSLWYALLKLDSTGLWQHTPALPSTRLPFHHQHRTSSLIWAITQTTTASVIAFPLQLPGAHSVLDTSASKQPRIKYLICNYTPTMTWRYIIITSYHVNLQWPRTK